MYRGTLDRITAMMKSLTSSIPLFQDWFKLFPVPRLKKAMVNVKNNFIDFCFSVFDFLSRRTLRMYQGTLPRATATDRLKIEQIIYGRSGGRHYTASSSSY